MTEKQRFNEMVDSALDARGEDWVTGWFDQQINGDLGLDFILAQGQEATGPFAEWAQEAVPECRLISMEPWYRALADRLEADLARQ